MKRWIHNGYTETDFWREGRDPCGQAMPLSSMQEEETSRRLPTNFKCADVICDFCGFLAQVKAVSSKNIETVPRTILGAAWRVQRKGWSQESTFLCISFGSMIAGSTPFSISRRNAEPGHLRREKATKRSGWQGFIYDLTGRENSIVRLI